MEMSVDERDKKSKNWFGGTSKGDCEGATNVVPEKLGIRKNVVL